MPKRRGEGRNKEEKELNKKMCELITEAQANDYEENIIGGYSRFGTPVAVRFCKVDIEDIFWFAGALIPRGRKGIMVCKGITKRALREIAEQKKYDVEIELVKVEDLGKQ